MVFEIVLHTFSPIIIVIKTVKMQTIILRSIYVWREFSVVLCHIDDLKKSRIR